MPTNPKLSYGVRNTQYIYENPKNVESEVENTCIIRVEKDMFSKPRIQHHIIVTTNARGLKVIELRACQQVANTL